MNILLKDHPELVLPFRAKPDDAGYDIVASSEPEIVGDKSSPSSEHYTRIAYIQYHTGLFVQPEENSDYLLVFPRSSISNMNLALANSVGTIDNGYRGEILIRFKYISQPEDLTSFVKGYGAFEKKSYAIKPNLSLIYKKGDKIAQLKGCKNIHLDFIKTIELKESDRGAGGFGSSGR